jgi:ribosome-binding protein aMBF1 (putative translation factor)
MENCQWCGSEANGRLVVSIAKNDFKVCEDCMNLYANRKYDNLADKIKKYLPDGKQANDTTKKLGETSK